jgi:hypothetical protein
MPVLLPQIRGPVGDQGQRLAGGSSRTPVEQESLAIGGDREAGPGHPLSRNLLPSAETAKGVPDTR